MKHILLSLITAYQRWISPHLGSHCRFYPSCSQYARLAIEQYGVRRGLWRSMWRILRCNPFTPGGIDYP